MDINVVMVSGNLTADVEFKQIVSGTAVAHFTVAVNRKYRSTTGIKEEKCFVRVVAFGKIAELCSERLRKGSGCFVKGRLRQENWEDKAGIKQQRTRVCVEDIKFFEKGEPKGEPRERDGNHY